MRELCDIDHHQFTRRSLTEVVLIGFFTISGLALAPTSKVNGQKSDNSCIYWTITNKQAEKIRNDFDISATDLSLLLNDLETTSSGPNILYLGSGVSSYDPGNGNIQQVDPGVMSLLELKLPDGENRGKYVKSYSSTIDCDRIPFERGIDGEITITPSSPAQGESVVLEASPIGIDADNVVSYEWKFGDTDSIDKIGQVVKTKFNQRQTIVSVKMSTDVGTSGKVTMTVSATPNPSLSPTFSYYPSTPRTSDEVQFNASDSKADGTDITAYEWDFTDDGTIDATGVNAVKQFDEGKHVVSLTVQDTQGNEETTEQVLEVEPERVNVSITASDTEVEVGGKTIIQYSVNNFLSSEELNTQLLVETPSDVNVTGVRGAQGSNQYTAEATVPPGEQQSMRVTIEVNAVGQHEITAIAEYLTTGEQAIDERVSKELLITAVDGAPEEKSTVSTETEDDSPGLGIGSGLAAIGGAGYILKSRMKNNNQN